MRGTLGKSVCVRAREMELKNGRVLLSAFDLAVEGIQGLSRRQEVMYHHHYSLEDIKILIFASLVFLGKEKSRKK